MNQPNQTNKPVDDSVNEEAVEENVESQQKPSLPKTKLLIIIASILCAVIVVGLAVYWVMIKTNKNVKPEPSLITYVGDEYGYEFSYPSNLTIRRLATENPEFVFKNVDAIDVNWTISVRLDDLTHRMEIDSLSFEDAIDRVILMKCDASGPFGEQYCTDITESKLYINDYGTKIRKVYRKLISKQFDVNEVKESVIGPTFVVFPEVNKLDYVFIAEVSGKRADLPEGQSILNQILSTFKFTDSINISGWQTHMNESHGFEFRHPDGWQTVDKKDCNFFELLVIPWYKNTIAYNSSPHISIRVEENLDNLTLKKYLDKNYYPFEDHLNSLEIVKSKDVEQSKSDAALERGMGYAGECGSMGLSDTDQFIARNKNQVFFITNSFYTGDDEKYKIIFDQILSTFKFTDVVDISEWQTYANEEYDYEIEYPKDLSVDEKDLDVVTIGTHVMPYISIEVYPGQEGVDFESFIQQKLVEKFGSLSDVNQIKWTEWAHTDIFDEFSIDAEFQSVAGGYDGKLLWTFISKGDKVYQISALRDYGEYSQQELQNQILSTFKFLP